jgi:hypothetical protein
MGRNEEAYGAFVKLDGTKPALCSAHHNKFMRQDFTISEA